MSYELFHFKEGLINIKPAKGEVKIYEIENRQAINKSM